MGNNRHFPPWDRVSSARGAASIGALLASAMGVGLLLLACAKQPGMVATEQPPPVAGPQVTDRGTGAAAMEVVTPTPSPPSQQPVPETAPAPLASPLKDIFFDFDRGR